jgi:hypothetical protein
MPKYVYTGYSGKQDGFLVLTDKDWDELAAENNSKYVRHKNKQEDVPFDVDFFIANDTDNVNLDYATHTPGWGVWHVYRTEIKTDTNLSNAVCW